MMSTQTATLLSERQLASPKRPAILDAAVGEFLANGFEGASMDRIAARAGVSKRTVYDHYSSKDGLVRAIARERLPRPEDFADFIYDPNTPLEPQLRKIGEVLLHVLTSDQFVALVRIMVAREVQEPEAPGAATADGRERFTASTVQWVEAASRDGRLAVSNPWLAVSQFLGSLQSAAFWPLVLNGRRLPAEDQEELVESSVAMFLNHYATP